MQDTKSISEKEELESEDAFMALKIAWESLSLASKNELRSYYSRLQNRKKTALREVTNIEKILLDPSDQEESAYSSAEERYVNYQRELANIEILKEVTTQLINDKNERSNRGRN